MEKKRTLIKMILLSLLLIVVAPCICGMGNAEARASIGKKKITLGWNKSKTISVKGATKKVKWTSSKPNVVRIMKIKGSKKQKATVKAVGTSGKAIITAKVGRQKLKMTVAVKHSHSLATSATCTKPGTCACGFVFVPALGHQWSAGTCVTPSRCSRCGVTGAKGSHILNSNGYCATEGCVKHDVVFWLDDEELGSHAGCVWLNLENSGRQSLQICDDASQGKGTLFLDDTTGANMTVYLVNSNTSKYTNFMYAQPGVSGLIQFHNGDTSKLITGSAHLRFYFLYGNQRYYADVNRDKKSWSFVAVP